MIFINATETIGIIMGAGTQNLTGTITATLLLILIILIVISMMFGMPLEFSVVLILPFCISMAAYYHTFMTPLIIIIIYISSIVAKNWLFR